MGLRHSIIFAKIQELVGTDRSVSACMGEVIAICSRDVPHPDWAPLAALEYDQDVASLASWIGNVFAREPPPFQIQGLWFGLCNPADDDGMVWADIYVGSVAQYSADDQELGWLWSAERHYPDDGFANSASLRSIYEIAYAGDGGLGNDAEWPLCLAFGAFAARELLRSQGTRLVASAAPRIGVVVGFDSGDMLKIGELTATGLLTA